MAGRLLRPIYGYLHLLVDGKTAQGAWRTGGGDAYGEMQGEVDGNVLRYSWTEHKIGQIGAEANSKGNGYFVYSIPKEGEAHKIAGEWGLGESDAGNPWEAVKQTNMQPNPDSVKPDEIEGKVNAGGWDDDGKGDKDGSEEAADGDAPRGSVIPCPATQQKGSSSRSLRSSSAARRAAAACRWARSTCPTSI